MTPCMHLTYTCCLDQRQGECPQSVMHLYDPGCSLTALQSSPNVTHPESILHHAGCTWTALKVLAYAPVTSSLRNFGHMSICGEQLPYQKSGQCGLILHKAETEVCPLGCLQCSSYICLPHPSPCPLCLALGCAEQPLSRSHLLG
jgi:hypothetical protein